MEVCIVQMASKISTDDELFLNNKELILAYDHIEGKNKKTPLIPFGKIHKNGVKINIYGKMDTFNGGGSFKDRGSEYFIHKAIKFGKLHEGDTVVTASAGNHAKGVARAARDHGLKPIIYMASNTPDIKIKGTENLGGKVKFIDGSYNDAAIKAINFAEKHNCVYVPAYEHSDIILGQSTVVTEALIQMYWLNIEPDFFVFPFGGGGLANGGGFALRNSKIRAYGVQAKNFDTMVQSFKKGEIVDYEYKGETIADGIRVPNASKKMLELSLKNLDDMFSMDEQEIRNAIKKIYYSKNILTLMKSSMAQLEKYGFSSIHKDKICKMNLIEGASAVAFACAFSDKIPYAEIANEIYPRKEITGVVIASGNNIDRDLLKEILREQ
jgi:threonine dehydratase